MTIYRELLFHRFIVTYLLMNMIHQKLKKAANIYTVDNMLLFHTQNTVATIQCWIVSFPTPPAPTLKCPRPRQHKAV